jgi:glyoxylase-like metal-dependent hydrolase (beta-lactamase superfamily II)/predicted ester cyclase
VGFAIGRRTLSFARVSAADVVTTYFDALARRDLDAMAACWAPSGEEHIASQVDAVGPDGVRAYFAELFGAFPDFRLEVRQTVAQDDRVAVHWRATATHAGPGRWQGLAPTGARVELEGIDLLRVADGQIVRNDAVADGLGLGRQLGLLPPAGSAPERGLYSAFNVRSAAHRALAGGPAEPIAEGVWVVRGGVPARTFNVYLVRDGDGVLAFDAGIRAMAPAIAAAAARLGGLTRVVLGHGHADHRGAAPALGVPVSCHEDAVVEVEGAGGRDYQRFDEIAPPMKWLMRRALASWDGGPVHVDRTLQEGDEVAGFTVVGTPGHARGQIVLWRERDRLSLSTDTFYTLDIGRGKRLVEPMLPVRGANWDHEQARASLRKLAALEPAASWPGHADGVTRDVRARLERAAAA